MISCQPVISIGDRSTLISRPSLMGGRWVGELLWSGVYYRPLSGVEEDTSRRDVSRVSIWHCNLYTKMALMLTPHEAICCSNNNKMQLPFLSFCISEGEDGEDRDSSGFAHG